MGLFLSTQTFDEPQEHMIHTCNVMQKKFFGSTLLFLLYLMNVLFMRMISVLYSDYCHPRAARIYIIYDDININDPCSIALMLIKAFADCAVTLSA